MKITHITRQEAINRIEAAIASQEEGKQKADSYSFSNKGAKHAWFGHEQRVIALTETLRRVNNGDNCNRSIAQLFSAGYRIGA